MKTRRWLWLLVVPAVLGAGLFTMSRASASPFFRGGHHAASSVAEVERHLGHKVEHLLDAVDASDAQRAQADVLVTRLSPQLFALMGEGRALRGELKTALLADKLDKAQISEIEAKLATLADKLVDAGMDGLVSVADLLTPAQRRQVADKLARMHP
jgi:Spy/CpxP family protein refolding chaperone